MRLGLVAGEISGDRLGAGLMAALTQRYPDAEFVGIPGPRMRAAGCQALAPMESINVMGLVEVLRHLPRLLKLRRQVRDYFLRYPVDAFIGIDAPDFNLPLEAALRAAGQPTVHYVSPSVWAWRQNRIHSIRKAVTHMLVLFPFELGFYQAHGIPATCVGHPAADALPLIPANPYSIRQRLQLHLDQPVIALLPGSRTGEVRRLLPVFLATVRWLLRQNPQLQFILPAATEHLRQLIQAACQPLPQVRVLSGQSREALEACDACLLASGTATLEALLLRKPMVVTYALAPLSHFLLKDLGWLKTPWVALPNLLAGETLVPELLQQALTPERLGHELLQWLKAPPAQLETLQRQFARIHASLRLDADHQAAAAVSACLRHV